MDEEIKKYIGPQERVLWSGRPKQGFVFRWEYIFFIFFGLFWLSGTTSDLNTKSIFDLVFSAPFVFVGIYLIFGPTLGDILQRNKSFYYVTNERIIIISGLIRKSVKSINTRTLSDTTLDQRPDGSGTITFGSNPFKGPFMWSSNYLPSFQLISDAKRVFDIIRDVQRPS